MWARPCSVPPPAKAPASSGRVKVADGFSTGEICNAKIGSLGPLGLQSAVANIPEGRVLQGKSRGKNGQCPPLVAMIHHGLERP